MMRKDHKGSRTIRISEPETTPPLSLLLGYAAMAPMPAGTALAWLLRGEASRRAATLTVSWGAAVLLFLAGVRRGLSFRTPGGPGIGQIATSLGLFGLGLGAVAAPRATSAPVLLIAGYLAQKILDPQAAREEEAPLFFARLRPAQMLIPVGSFTALLVRRAAHR